MKVFIVVLLALIAVASAEDTYTTKYDGIDLEEILKSERLFNNYYKCLMETGRCTPDGNELKRVLPDALLTGCTKCSDAQRRGSERVLRFILDNKPEQWKPLQQKYDPDNVYITKYRPEADRLGIKV